MDMPIDTPTRPPSIHHADDNTSSMDVDTTAPPAAKRWNWGAFMFPMIWLRGNNLTGRDVDAFMRSKGRLRVGRMLFYVLGAEANELAWRHRRWPNIQAFTAVQRRWNIAGLTALGLLSGAIVYLLGITLYAVLAN